MYTRKYEAEEPAPEEEFRLPENYAGNAFSKPLEEETATPPPSPPEEPKEEPRERPKEEPPPADRDHKAFPLFDRIISPDVLLLVLAFLLMGENGTSDLSSILLFLLLIDGSKE